MFGVAGFALATAGSYAVTQRTDPSFGNIGRNNVIAAALVAGGGVVLALKKSPMFGAALAAGALAAAFGSKASIALNKLIPAPSATPEQLAAVYGQDGMAAAYQLAGYESMQGYESLQAVYGQDGMAAVDTYY